MFDVKDITKQDCKELLSHIRQFCPLGGKYGFFLGYEPRNSDTLKKIVDVQWRQNERNGREDLYYKECSEAILQYDKIMETCESYPDVIEEEVCMYDRTMCRN